MLNDEIVRGAGSEIYFFDRYIKVKSKKKKKQNNVNL